MPSSSPTPAQAGLLVQTVGAARILLINRPERRNAMTPELAARLACEIERTPDDRAIRSVVLRGAGGHFSVGLYLKWFASLETAPSPGELVAGLRGFQDTIRAIVRCPLPVLAVLEGNVAGIGLDIALACDLRIAGESATLSSAFSRIGLVPDGGSTLTLRRLAGSGIALEILLTGDPIDAKRALSLGLVSAVHPDARLEAEARTLTERIAANARGSLERIKELVRADERESLDARLETEGKAQIEALGSREFRERLRRFLGG